MPIQWLGAPFHSWAGSMAGAQRCAPTYPMDRIYPHRLSTRMPLFDYGQSGAYFVSLVAIGRQPLFGRILNNAVQLSDAGLIVREEWLRPPLIRPGVYLDDWTIMPDHFHAILIIDMDIHRDMGTVGAHRCAPAKTLHRQPRTLGSVIAQFKATTTKCINDLRGTPGEKVWQRGYNDRVIRNEVELDKLREYIQNNARFQGHNL